MKKLLALLTALSLLMTPALAEASGLLGLLSSLNSENPSEDECMRIIYGMINAQLTREGITYESDQESMCSYFTLKAEKSSLLGDAAHISLYAFWDGVCINASSIEAVPADSLDEIVKLCNHLNSMVYIGKFYIYEYADGSYIHYEVFLPMNASQINDYDRRSIIEYMYLTGNTLTQYQEYFEYILSGETADNAFAMRIADTSD